MNLDCQARSVQPTDPVTSPLGGQNVRPMWSLRSRQDNTGIIVTTGVGSPSVIVAHGSGLAIKNGVMMQIEAVPDLYKISTK